MTELTLEGVRVRRGGATVLHDVSLSVTGAEVVALLGTNGAGKSTTLRTISGLHRPYAGEIRLNGKVVNGTRPENVVRRGIAHVPEGRQVFVGLTVRENLEMGARIRGRLTSADLDRVLGLFPALGSMLGKRAGVLSGGQQQMLAIARGLLARPELLLLDEPSLGLAPKVVDQIGAAIGQLPALGMGVLLVEQNATLALDVASRGYLMTGGRTITEGTAGELGRSEAVRAAYFGGGPA
ncbi:MAG TPA: ABC transporter ATP-binding protein [Amycolatopsis sp.]|nr:ABC transporter ATP-binding protein [Amycolatopsis sp.]